MGWKSLLFIPTGRIGRQPFFLALAGLYVVWLVAPFMFALLGALSGPRGAAIVSQLIALLGLLQMLLLPYVSACLHAKRLRDAGRGLWSLMTIVVFSLVTPPLAVVLLARPKGLDTGSIDGLVTATALVMAGFVVIGAWLAYSLWVGLGRPRPESREAHPVATQFQ
jgi:uncharacterized membrane protein YhaH (DUF805 family)